MKLIRDWFAKYYDRCQLCGKLWRRSKMFAAGGGVLWVCMKPAPCRKRYAEKGRAK